MHFHAAPMHVCFFLIDLFSAIRYSFAECISGLYFFFSSFFFLCGGGCFFFLMSPQSFLVGESFPCRKKRERYISQSTNCILKHGREVRWIFWLTPEQLHVGPLSWATEAFSSS